MRIEDLIDLMESDTAGAEKLSPIEFARLIGIAPQMVYYHIKRGVIETEDCICGRRVVDVRRAAESLQAKKGESGRSDLAGIVARHFGSGSSEEEGGSTMQAVREDDPLEGPFD